MMKQQVAWVIGASSGLGLHTAMALAKNSQALERFNSLSETERKAFIAGTRSVRSKEEMRDYVSRLNGSAVL